MIYTTVTNENNNDKKATSLRLVAILLVLACIPHRVSARYGTCSGSRWHYGRHFRDYGNSGFWNNHRWDNRRCGRSCRRYRRSVIDLFDGIVEASLNSLARRERARQRRRFFVQDYGMDGMELSLDTGGLTANEIDLEVTEIEQGDRILLVSGLSNSAELSESFALHHSIDVGGIRASVSSGVLKIALPRKKPPQRIVPSLRDVLLQEDSNYDDEKIPVHKTQQKKLVGSSHSNQKLRGEDEALLYDTKRGDFYGSSLAKHRKRRIDNDETHLYDIRRGDFSGPSLNKRKKRKGSSGKSVVVEETSPRASQKEIPRSKQKDQEDDDGLWISEEEYIW